jgi:hypothetical protein
MHLFHDMNYDFALWMTPLTLIKQHQSGLGYARVSSIGQNLDSQTDALQKASCIKILRTKITGSRLSDRDGISFWNIFAQMILLRSWS